MGKYWFSIQPHPGHDGLALSRPTEATMFLDQTKKKNRCLWQKSFKIFILEKKNSISEQLEELM